MEQFTEEQIAKIKHLNELLKGEEKRVLLFSKKLQSSLDEMIEQKQMDDYKFISALALFSDNAECNKRNKKEEDAPIYVELLSIFTKTIDDCLFTNDWNELDSAHPLKQIHFCYSMHCIKFHSRFTWEDILQIDDVWFDIKVDYKFMVNIKN